MRLLQTPLAWSRSDDHGRNGAIQLWLGTLPRPHGPTLTNQTPNGLGTDDVGLDCGRYGNRLESTPECRAALGIAQSGGAGYALQELYSARQPKSTHFRAILRPVRQWPARGESGSRGFSQVDLRDFSGTATVTITRFCAYPEHSGAAARPSSGTTSDSG